MTRSAELGATKIGAKALVALKQNGSQRRSLPRRTLDPCQMGRLLEIVQKAAKREIEGERERVLERVVFLRLALGRASRVDNGRKLNRKLCRLVRLIEAAEGASCVTGARDKCITLAAQGR